MTKVIRLPEPGTDPKRKIISPSILADIDFKRLQSIPINFSDIQPNIRLAHRMIGNISVAYRRITDFEIIIILEGQGDFYYQQQRYSYGPQSLLFIQPNIAHTLITRCGPLGDHLAIHFDITTHTPKPHQRARYRIDCPEINEIAPIMKLDKQSFYIACQLVRLHRKQNKPEPTHSHLRIRTLLQQLLLHLIDRQRNPLVDQSSDPEIGKALNYLSQHYAEALQVEDLAQAAGLARSRFAQRFKICCGETPMSFVRRYRIDRAAEYLQHHSSSSLNEIAQHCGFADSFSLSKAFKRELGLSPNEYRKQIPQVS